MPHQSTLINDHENTFLVVAVPKLVLDDHDKAEQIIQFLQLCRAGLPGLRWLLAMSSGAPTAYFGPGDLAIRLLRRPATR